MWEEGTAGRLVAKRKQLDLWNQITQQPVRFSWSPFLRVNQTNETGAELNNGGPSYTSLDLAYTFPASRSTDRSSAPEQLGLAEHIRVRLGAAADEATRGPEERTRNPRVLNVAPQPCGSTASGLKAVLVLSIPEHTGISVQEVSYTSRSDRSQHTGRCLRNIPVVADQFKYNKGRDWCHLGQTMRCL